MCTPLASPCGSCTQGHAPLMASLGHGWGIKSPRTSCGRASRMEHHGVTGSLQSSAGTPSMRIGEKGWVGEQEVSDQLSHDTCICMLSFFCVKAGNGQEMRAGLADVIGKAAGFASHFLLCLPIRFRLSCSYGCICTSPLVSAGAA